MPDLKTLASRLKISCLSKDQLDDGDRAAHQPIRRKLVRNKQPRAVPLEPATFCVHPDKAVRQMLADEVAAWSEEPQPRPQAVADVDEGAESVINAAEASSSNMQDLTHRQSLARRKLSDHSSYQTAPQSLEDLAKFHSELAQDAYSSVDGSSVAHYQGTNTGRDFGLQNPDSQLHGIRVPSTSYLNWSQVDEQELLIE